MRRRLEVAVAEPQRLQVVCRGCGFQPQSCAVETPNTSPTRKRVVRPRTEQPFHFLSVKASVVAQTNHSLARRARTLTGQRPIPPRSIEICSKQKSAESQKQRAALPQTQTLFSPLSTVYNRRQSIRCHFTIVANQQDAIGDHGMGPGAISKLSLIHI